MSPNRNRDQDPRPPSDTLKGLEALTRAVENASHAVQADRYVRAWQLVALLISMIASAVAVFIAIRVEAAFDSRECSVRNAFVTVITAAGEQSGRPEAAQHFLEVILDDLTPSDGC